MSRNFHRPSAAYGMTLVEILVAVSVSTLVVTVALTVYFTFSRSFRGLDAARHQSALAAIEILQTDLLSCMQAAFSNIPPFELQTKVSGDRQPLFSTLAFCSGEALIQQAESGQLSVYHRRYAIHGDGTNSQLNCESACLWGPNAMELPSSNTIMRGVTQFEVNALVADHWTNQWRSTATIRCPRAARIRMDWQEGGRTGSISRIIFIPAGNSIPAPRHNQRNSGATASANRQ